FNFTLSAPELAVLQELSQPNLSEQFIQATVAALDVWLAVERILRQYAQYHFDRQIRSAALVDACFMPT
ncbi:MAG TPA: DNA repair protein RecO, partial [Thermosynechococcaceae cyanobacterium]